MYIRVCCIKTVIQGLKISKNIKRPCCVEMNGTAVDSAGGISFNRKFADTYLKFLQA